MQKVSGGCELTWILDEVGFIGAKFYNRQAGIFISPNLGGTACKRPIVRMLIFYTKWR